MVQTLYTLETHLFGKLESLENPTYGQALANELTEQYVTHLKWEGGHDRDVDFFRQVVTAMENTVGFDTLSDFGKTIMLHEGMAYLMELSDYTDELTEHGKRLLDYYPMHSSGTFALIV